MEIFHRTTSVCRLSAPLSWLQQLAWCFLTSGKKTRFEFFPVKSPIAHRFQAYTHVINIKACARTPYGCLSSLDCLSCLMVKSWALTGLRSVCEKDRACDSGLQHPIGPATCHYMWSSLCICDKLTNTNIHTSTFTNAHTSQKLLQLLVTHRNLIYVKKKKS